MADYRKDPGDYAGTNRPASPAPSLSRQIRFKPVKNRVLRGLLFGCGWIAVALGVAGIFLPVLPTTPFLLLAAACFLRSSSRFYAWLIGHPRLGPYLTYYLDGQGMPYRAKLYTLALLWSTMIFSAWLVGNGWLTAFLAISGISVSIYIGRLPVREPPER